MSADSFLHQVENGIREVKKLYDLQDFVRCVESKGTAVLMESKDFINFQMKKVLQKTQANPKIAEMSQVHFKKTSTIYVLLTLERSFNLANSYTKGFAMHV